MAKYTPERIAEHLQINPAAAAQVRQILDLKLEKFELCEIEEQQNAPAYMAQYEAPSRKLHMIAHALQADGYHGVESWPSNQDTCTDFQGFEYLNSGDTYSPTLIYDYARQKWSLTTCGDVVEADPARFDEDFQEDDDDEPENDDSFNPADEDL